MKWKKNLYMLMIAFGHNAHIKKWACLKRKVDNNLLQLQADPGLHNWDEAQ
jgi:hypothetical protein